LNGVPKKAITSYSKRYRRPARTRIPNTRIAYRIAFSSALSIESIYEEEKKRWLFKPGHRDQSMHIAFKKGWDHGKKALFNHLTSIGQFNNISEANGDT